MVGDAFSEPMGGEFRVTFDEVSYGVSLHDAPMNLAARVPVQDLRYFVIAVLIRRETAGNLAELLEHIAGLIRERFKLLDKVRALSDMLRTRRRMRAEERAAKIALKLLFPLIFCIFPALMVLLLGPAMIHVYRVLLPTFVGVAP